MIRVLIIDDESSQREYLAFILRNNFDNLHIVGEADGVHSGLEAINKHSPDLVFLDIRLKDGEGFDILKKLNRIDFKVIFISGFQDYAMKAVKFRPLEYLLKPVTIADLKNAIEKAKNRIIEDLKTQMADMQTNIMKVKNRRIILRTSEMIHLIPMRDIVRCEANRNYCNFFLSSGKKITVCQPMKDFEKMLTGLDFFRLHKSHIVNLKFVETFIRADGGQVVLSDGTALPVADRKKASLLEKFKDI